MNDSIQNTLDKVTELNTKRKKDDPATWGDLQDLRRGLMAYIDVKIDDLKTTLGSEIKEIKQILQEKL